MEFLFKNHGNFDSGLKFTLFGRWYRFGLFIGSPPGSNMGYWRTKGGFSGTSQGWNYRFRVRSTSGEVEHVTVLFHTGVVA